MKPPPNPGPWQISGAIQPSTRPDGLKIVTICAPDPDGGGQDIGHVLENCAPVVAAAPDLLAALKKVTLYGHRLTGPKRVNFTLAMDQARAAIARATISTNPHHEKSKAPPTPS
jgi:hypothetical protein